MKKIGILTLFDHNNYGALLQAFALMTTLKKEGVDISFISLSDSPEQKPNVADLPLFIKKIKMEGYKRNLLFDDFRNKWLPFERFNTLSESDYDLFIVGSDQVWNPEIFGNDDRFFLCFTSDQKKASYAASFGKQHLDEQLKCYLKTKLDGFKGPISVRESTGVNLVKELTGKTAQVCLDPTLLTVEEDWINIINSESSVKNDKPYLLLIMVQSNTSLYEQAKKIATEKDLDLKLITASYFPTSGFEPWSGTTVPKYLNLISNASYVLTTSFHGIALSIIFHKQFGFSLLTDELASRNTRMIELLDSLCLSDRIGFCENVIDWNKVDSKLLKLKKESIEYLQGLVK